MTSHSLVATYRIQLRDGVTLDSVVDDGLLDDLDELGVSHLYLSPVLTAAPGSTHGYDVTDPSHVDPAIGGDDAFRRLAKEADRRGMGLIVDVVPNHMATDHRANPWWWDVLANGPASTHASFFDIDWLAPEGRLRGRVVVPVLPDHLGREIERHRFRLRLQDGEIVAEHPAVEAPIEAASSAPLWALVADRTGDPQAQCLAEDLALLPPPDASGEERARRLAQVPGLTHRAAALSDIRVVRDAMAEVLAELEADPDRLDDLLLAQPYRLTRWQAGVRDLAYRRFFDVNGLVALRMDRAEVFAATHDAVLGWVADGSVDGIRIDHPDGLRDPAGYLRQLRAAMPDGWLVVEKILEPGERLPDAWPVDGTTGYDVAELIGRLHLDDRGRAALEAIATSVGASVDVHDTIVDATAQVLADVLAADLGRLTSTLLAVCERHRRYRDFTRHEIHETLRETIARFPRYRTYTMPGARASDEERAVVDAATAAASAARPDLDPELFVLLRSFLCDPDFEAPEERDVRARFEQLTGPAKAKGQEDTAWYRLIASLHRTEVGAAADRWELDLDEFHREMELIQDRYPTTMTTLSTHDSKRSEDVRARLAVLTELPDEWTELTGYLLDHLDRPDAITPPDPGSAYYLIQTLVTAHPLPLERAWPHMRKAAREAKLYSSWLDPDVEYERHLESFVGEVCGDPVVREALDRFDERIRVPARIVSLAQKALQLTVPGVPDLYQGTEHWSLRLTDPDNRSTLDLALLRRALVSDPVPTDREHLASDDAGVTKVQLVRHLLRLRRRHPAAFGPGGSYRPLWASGPRSDHAVGFARGDDVVVVVPRKVVGLADGWMDTELDLPDGSWRHAFGEDTARLWRGRVPLAELFQSRVVVALEREVT